MSLSGTQDSQQDVTIPIMCIYTHTCTHTHTCIHPHIHAYICTYLHTRMHAYIHTYIHKYMHAYMHACMHAYIDMHVFVYVCMYACMPYVYVCLCVCACVCVCILMYRHCMYACMYVCTYVDIYIYKKTCPGLKPTKKAPATSRSESHPKGMRTTKPSLGAEVYLCFWKDPTGIGLGLNFTALGFLGFGALGFYSKVALTDYLCLSCELCVGRWSAFTI